MKNHGQVSLVVKGGLGDGVWIWVRAYEIELIMSRLIFRQSLYVVIMGRSKDTILSFASKMI